MSENDTPEKAAGHRPARRFGIGALVKHRLHGRGRILAEDAGTYMVHLKGEVRRVPMGSSDLEADGPVGDPEFDAMKQALREVLGDAGWIETEFEISPRWSGGTIRLIPGKEGVQEKEIPIDAFLKKVIGVREKLRVLEQKINNHPRLEQEEKIELEGYITRCYGSLTSFNILFAEKPSHFVGSGKE